MKFLLILKLILRSVLPPFYSLDLIEKILKDNINKNPSDNFAKWILSNIYVEYNKYPEAESILESLLDSDKSNKSVLLLLSRVYYNINKTNDVIKILNNGQVLSDSDKENYYLAISLMELGKHADALSCFKRYVSNVKIRDSNVYVNLGFCCYKENLYDEALLNYKKAMNLGGDKEEISKLIDICKKESQQSE